MTSVDRDGDGFVVDASLLAEAFGVPEGSVPALMKDGQITSRCEAGVDEDAGTFRLTFFHAGRACRFTVDAAGTVFRRATFDRQSRPTGRSPLPDSPDTALDGPGDGPGKE
ncbi:MAG: hypothetical protein IPL38_05735 [Rhodobacter sp.]|nr:hypothetical protein [Rhodobacter sp.]MBK8439019.1 hypothetical protein [Rhodobacter sp.]